MAAASAARHDTRALLRAHLAAASRYGHLTRHCVICHRLLRLAMEAPETSETSEAEERAQAQAPAVEDEGPADP
ncbi:hypothetical protein GCM10010497_41140 [Streptomyces cinereoruber]|uniref:Uncharacterized protein n=1 Tax=Streptomyces cinereoruber TaxID=67260 RepID=A0AAV4KM27_9ACTN|nr:DUF6274 family protein [Streptomyces cinereoruber]MBB4159588.1 hypothetical protein [Streptomyces cinereoruber]MBY8818042.1 DUF6274 family protein [Streptomyces cinereoruber]NIH60296.1 hypothetical protein [Streptomyces cinereoruber]QEV33906.1 hypothetical protein CP977_18455 [Streptomyces cinereoruber]GGR34002.1 hypothetical protein GCM10010497_41140 [Streptomyces cinereoruber]